MKTLHIVRHGKSSWDLPGISDIDRPLIEKGVQNNYVMAERLKAKFEKPQLILSSPAIRAIHTAIIFARILNVSVEFIQFRNNIYESEPSFIFEIIEEAPININNLMIFGHNPTFTDFANHFLIPKIDNLPTSGIVSLQFNSKNWHIKNVKPILREVDYPKIN
jgi:phosphohistidine phosphatase